VFEVELPPAMMDLSAPIVPRASVGVCPVYAIENSENISAFIITLEKTKPAESLIGGFHSRVTSLPEDNPKQLGLEIMDLSLLLPELVEAAGRDFRLIVYFTALPYST
jgi:hypothetical protein